jgi:hypothetical protein
MFYTFSINPNIYFPWVRMLFKRIPKSFMEMICDIKKESNLFVKLLMSIFFLIFTIIFPVGLLCIVIAFLQVDVFLHNPALFLKKRIGKSLQVWMWVVVAIYVLAFIIIYSRATK